MEEKMKQVLYKWLEIDLVNIAKKMGLSDKSCDVNLELLTDTIRCLDYESIIVEKPSINYIITVIGLMWEHVDHTKFDLRKFVIKILSRIGYPTSAIICDKDFDKENGTFSGLDSWIDEVALTINQMKNEIMVANQKYLLTDYQKQIWDSMDNDKVLGISAPTSAGKSFVILLKLVDRLINDNIDIVYIVPTLSLLNQVTEDFNRELKKVGVTDYWISNSFDDQQLSNKKNIYIMTQEKAIADKKINTVVCTTTLLQGVNLPAQNVFIRNPHLYVKKQKESSELTNYEMANLRGRAGRLLKDYIGRTFVMDEDEFIDSDGYEQLELFEDVTKELPSGYEQKFEEYKDFIEEALDNNTPVDATMKKYGYIISYIRQSVLKYGAESRGRMKNVGIKLTQKQVAAIILKLDSIDVPKEICYKNRYWDPLVLDYIYNEYDGKLPNTPMEKGAKSKLDKAMRFLRENDVTAEMYNKNIPSTYRKKTMRSIMSSLSLQWATGKALCEILNNSRYEGDDGADNIDSTIELLQNTISYNLPLLLKPLYDMKQSESPFLKCMQVGAFGVVERCMIEMGVPRESALYLYKEIFDEKEIKVENRLELEQIIREKIRLEYKNIPYWIQVQLDFLI